MLYARHSKMSRSTLIDMSELTELYQEVILDHNRKPRNCGEMEDFSGQADGYNPLCGDRIKVFLRLEGGPDHRYKISRYWLCHFPSFGLTHDRGCKR